MNYSAQIRALLSPAEHRVFEKLSTPQKIQDYLESLPQNFPRGREGMLSPRGVLKAGKAHCMEGAVFAAASLSFHGNLPLLLDIQSADIDLDHVVAPFKKGGLWGAISKTNHPVLRYRDPVYKNVRELTMSYFHEYFWPDKDKYYRQKTMLAHSRPFDLRHLKPERWVTAEKIDWLAEELDRSPHSPIAPRLVLKDLRLVNPVEVKAWRLTEWTENGKKNRA